MTILTKSVLLLSVSVANSQPLTNQRISKTVLVGDSIQLDCPYDGEQIIWNYAENEENEEKNWWTMFGLNKLLNIKLSSAPHLVGQVSYVENSHTLNLQPNSINMAGIYKCGDFLKTQEIIYNVDVYQAPTIEILEKPEVMVSGENYRFSCSVDSASPKPFITWYWNGQVFDGAAEETESENSDGTWNLESLIEMPLKEDYKQEKFQIECRANPPKNEWNQEPANNVIPVEFKPNKPEIENIVVVAANSEDQILTCGSNVQAAPKPDFDWVLDPRLKNYTNFIHNKLTVFNIPLSLNESMITCKAFNKHGSQQITKKLIVVEARFEEQANMSSNTILMIGVIVAAVLLAVLGGIVTYRRCSQQADYQTREDAKTAGPDGISYEQNPEVEALAPGEEKVQKELLM